MAVKILSILKRKNSGLILHWKMSVSYRCLKSVLCIQELDDFGYIPLSISLRPSPFSPLPVCVLKILSILKKKKRIIYRVQRHMGAELVMVSGLFTFGIRHIKVLFRGVAYL